MARPRPDVLFFALTLLALLVIFRERGLNDPGTLWHTRVGELILEHGLMTVDPFTFTFAGRTWIPQQWGGEVLMTFLHRLGGFDAMLFAFSALFALAFTLAFRRLLAGGMGWPLAAAVTALAIVAAGFHFYVRPHVFTIVFMVLSIGIIADYDARRATWRYLIWLIPIHIIWTNLHGGMLGGVATLALAILGWSVSWLLKLSSPINGINALLKISILFIACMFTMFINPIGIELQKTWFRLIGSKILAEFIPEHSPLDPTRGGDLAVLGFAALYAVIVLGALPRFRPLWFIPVVWFVLSLQSIRNGPLFVAVAAVLIAEIWPHTFWYRWLRRGGDTLGKETAALPRMNWLVPIVIILAGLAVCHFRLISWARFDPRYIPLDMIDAVKAIPDRERIYNDPNLGGFLIWHAPQVKIFMDDRFELCGDDWLREYVNTISEHPERFESWQQQYDFRWALVMPGATPALDEYLRKQSAWTVAHRGATATLYRR